MKMHKYSVIGAGILDFEVGMSKENKWSHATVRIIDQGTIKTLFRTFTREFINGKGEASGVELNFHGNDEMVCIGVMFEAIGKKLQELYGQPLEFPNDYNRIKENK